jgi:SWI/SNF-related matrix-associated actin-dependent regulator of chromatin subfamily A member 5
VVTTFEMLVAEANFFRRKYMWTSVIVDEGHRLKNEKSQLSEKLRMVPTICKIILTGTPLQNNLRELWALLHFLAPEIFTLASSETFDNGFDLLRKKIDANVLRNARRLLNVFMLRRLKDHVNIKLPSKKEITLVVSLTERQTEWYKQLLCGLDQNLIEVVMKESENAQITTDDDTAITSTTTVRKRGRAKLGIEQYSSHPISEDENGEAQNTVSDWRKLMNLLLQLRKICNHIYLMPEAAPDPYEVTEDIIAGSGKLLLLDRMLKKLHEDKHRVLIFSQFTSMLDILEDYCDLRQWSFARLDGNTNRVQRRLDVRRFNAPNSPLFIFLISTRAGGLGLNLASADTVILYDSDWNPMVSFFYRQYYADC